MSIEICTSVITFPSFNDYYEKLADLKLKFDPSALSLPTLPSPLFANLNSPDLYVSNLASQLSATTFLNFIKAALEPLMTFIGNALDSIPKVPYLNLSLDDLINGFDINNLIKRLPSFSVPLLPDPLLANIEIPEYNLVQKVVTLINSYCSSLLTFATGIIDSVINKLSKKPFNFAVSFPGLPTLPGSFDELIAPIYAKIGAFDVEGMIEKYTAKLSLPSLPQVFMSTPFAGLDDLNFSVPDPLFKGFSSPAIEISELAKNYYQSLVNACGALIQKFCDAVSNFISFSFPTVCVPVPTIDGI